MLTPTPATTSSLKHLFDESSVLASDKLLWRMERVRRLMNSDDPPRSNNDEDKNIMTKNQVRTLLTVGTWVTLTLRPIVELCVGVEPEEQDVDTHSHNVEEIPDFDV